MAAEKMQNLSLTSYWIEFLDLPEPMLGFGVTAWSEDDALNLLESAGIDHHKRDHHYEIKAGITISDLDQLHVVPNMGPMVLRGVWFPRLNL